MPGIQDKNTSKTNVAKEAANANMTLCGQDRRNLSQGVLVRRAANGRKLE